MQDRHNSMKVLRCVSPVAVGTTGVGVKGTVIDRSGYDSCEFIVAYGAFAGVAAVVTPIIQECDNATTGNFTSVADADLIGTELLASLPAANPRVSGVSKNVTKRIGYRGKKQYVRALISATVTAVPPVSIDVILQNPRVAPVSNP